MYMYMQAGSLYSIVLSDFLNNAHWDSNIANAWLPYINMRILQTALILVLRDESKYPTVKSLASAHSACPWHVKIMSPKCLHPACASVFCLSICLSVTTKIARFGLN
jgi:hypothetical protein